MRSASERFSPSQDGSSSPRAAHPRFGPTATPQIQSPLLNSAVPSAPSHWGSRWPEASLTCYELFSPCLWARSPFRKRGRGCGLWASAAATGGTGASSSERQPWLSRGAAGGPDGARRLRPQRPDGEAGGAAGPGAPRRDRQGARHQLELWGGECGEERHAPSGRAAFKFVVWPQQLSWERLSLSKKGMLKTPGITSPLPISSPSPLAPLSCARASPPQRVEVHPCRRAGCQQRGLNGAPATLRHAFPGWPPCALSVRQPLTFEPVPGCLWDLGILYHQIRKDLPRKKPHNVRNILSLKKSIRVPVRKTPEPLAFKKRALVWTVENKPRLRG